MRTSIWRIDGKPEKKGHEAFICYSFHAPFVIYWKSFTEKDRSMEEKMTKSEFLEALETKLSGEVSQRVVNQNLSYYSEYIDNAVRQGKREEEVLEELGSPFLIARTIIDVNGSESAGETPFQSYQEKQREETRWDNRNFHESHWNILPGAVIAGVLIVLILLLVLAFTVLRILLPILLPVILILFVIFLFKNRK